MNAHSLLVMGSSVLISSLALPLIAALKWHARVRSPLLFWFAGTAATYCAMHIGAGLVLFSYAMLATVWHGFRGAPDQLPIMAMSIVGEASWKAIALHLAELLAGWLLSIAALHWIAWHLRVSPGERPPQLRMPDLNN